MSCILYRETASVGVIGLKRTEAANAFFGSLCTEFPTAMKRAAESAAVRAVVLAPGDAFLAEVAPDGETSDGCIPGVRAISTIPKPVIAAIDQSVSGIGLSYVLACDFIAIARGACMRSTDSLHLSAERCLQLGLANRTSTDTNVLNEAEMWAKHFAHKSPEALAVAKRGLCGSSYP